MMSGHVKGIPEELALGELIETDFLKCFECREIFVSPHILPCLHTFCLKCIEKIWQRQSKEQAQTEEIRGKPNDQREESKALPNGSRGINGIQNDQMDETENVENGLQNEDIEGHHSYITCPICKSAVGVHALGIEKYRENPFLKDLCEIHDYKHRKERLCEYCKYDQKKSEATALCLDCQDDMCNTCSDAHRKTKVTRGHAVIPYSQIVNGLYDTDIRSHQQQRCPSHGCENLNMFCNKCEVLICKECKVRHHDNHKWSKAEDAVVKYHTQLQNLVQGIRKQIPSIYDYIKFLSKYEESVGTNHEGIIQKLQEQAKLLHQMVDEQTAGMMDLITQSSQQEKKDLQAKKINMGTAAMSLQNNADYLGQLLHHGKPDEVLALHRELTQRLTQLMHLQLDGIDAKLRMHFVPGNSTKQNVNTLIGKLAIDRAPIGGKEKRTADHENMRITTMLPTVRKTADLIMSFEASGKNDGKDVWPTGTAITKYDEIVIVDRDNKNVKVFDETGQLKAEFQGKGDHKLGSPFDVAVLKNGNIAVTDHECDDVKIFSTMGTYQTSITGQFKYPRGITVNSKGEVIVLDCTQNQLTFHDPIKGSLLQTIQCKDAQGDKVLVDPYYVAVTPEDNIIITDTAAPNMKFFSKDGKYLGEYGQYGTQEDQILQPQGICTDNYGYMFIADNQNNRIHVLLPDGKFSQFVLTKTDGLWHPMGLGITKNGYLVVTEALGKVKIYKYI